MKALPYAMIAAAAALLIVGCGEGPLVVQGHVKSVDPAAKVLRLVDEAQQGAELEIFLADAEIGAEPAEGDVLRIAYRTLDGRHVASRVMNLTKQAKLLGSGGGH